MGGIDKKTLVIMLYTRQIQQKEDYVFKITKTTFNFGACGGGGDFFYQNLPPKHFEVKFWLTPPPPPH